MSNTSTPRGMALQPKQISSRLLNMKFMQRAAATEKTKLSITTPQTPTSEPSAKRRRTGEYASGLYTPTTPRSGPATPAYSDRSGAFSTFRADDSGSALSRGRHNFDAQDIETEWVLNVQISGTKNNQYSEHDAGGVAQNAQEDMEYDEEDEEEREEEEDDDDDIWTNQNSTGRQTYGSFKKKKRISTGTSTISTPIFASKSAKRNSFKSQGAPVDSADLSPLDSDSNTGSESESLESDDGEDSELSSDDARSAEGSDSESGEASSDELPHKSKNKNKTSRGKAGKPQKPKIDFTSEDYLRKMDAMDFSKSGSNQGLGRQRTGLGGQTGGGGSGGHHHRHQGSTAKNRSHLVGQDGFDRSESGKRNKHHHRQSKNSNKKAKMAAR